MADGDDPAVYRRRLRVALRRLRLSAGLTQKDVAERLEWSPSKMLRIESGISSIGTTDLRVLLGLYGVTDSKDVEEMVEMGRSARRQTWRDRYRPHIEPQLFAFLEYEAASIAIQQFQSIVVPGLLQTEEYTRKLSEPFFDNVENLERGIEIRLKRQEILDQPGGPDLVFLLDESVFHNKVGDWDIMRRQHGHIVNLAGRQNITVRVVPFGSEQHFGMGGSFIICDLSDDVEDRVVVLEEPSRDILIRNDRTQIQKYSSGFAEIEQRALSAESSLVFIDNLMQALPAS